MSKNSGMSFDADEGNNWRYKLPEMQQKQSGYLVT